MGIGWLVRLLTAAEDIQMEATAAIDIDNLLKLLF